MFVWMNGFQNPLIYTDFNMFLDEYTSINEIPELASTHNAKCTSRTCMTTLRAKKLFTLYIS